MKKKRKTTALTPERVVRGERALRMLEQRVAERRSPQGADPKSA